MSIDGLKVRSRAVWYEEGEQNKEYFEQLLKSNKKKTSIQEMCNDKGEVIKEKNAILRLIRAFYGNLYSENALTHDAHDNSIEKVCFFFFFFFLQISPN